MKIGFTAAERPVTKIVQRFVAAVRRRTLTASRKSVNNILHSAAPSTAIDSVRSACLRQQKGTLWKLQTIKTPFP
jgi:hypothetical protein